MPRKVLIVDDNAINRELLKNTLCRDYDTIEAQNGKEALELIHRNYKMLSAVLLDIVMPEMDGYELLRRVRDNVLLSQIPVIMVTGSEDEASRVKALSLGANDFILKPFNPEIVKHCLKNNIALRETASILNAIQKDKLTGLYNREAFFEKVGGMIADREPGYYVLSCFDIDNFKLINDQYGAAEGDRILREIGKAVGKNAEEIDGIAGRISADNFAALFPADRKITMVLQRILDKSLVSLEQQSVSFSIGRYVVTDLSLPASAIYDRAFIAKQSVKGRYDEHLAYFDDTMLEKLVREQQITGEMETALAERQFEAWFQPQYNHATGELLGAEALARWRHPQKGIIPPGEFIPLFEQNGFVYELDKYVWGEVCRYLRRWLNKGYAPLPVSVNISRYDIFRADLIDVLQGLVREHQIPVELLRLEITESAFSSSPTGIVSIVKQLIRLGFTVEIDDFGSGYSSLNTLKNVPAQVVKLDMRFMEGGDDSQRGGSILESIVRMTKWLGMTVLAEGVEEPEQADFLKSIGCTYVQGYLYARPVPASDYEALLAQSGPAHPPAPTETSCLPLSDAFWNPKSIDTVVFNKYSGGACVYEFHNGQIELIRATDKYIHSVFGSKMSAEEAMKLDWNRHVDLGTGASLIAAVRESIRTKKEVSGEYLFLNLPGCPRETCLRTTLRVIASTDDRHLVYCTSENITPQIEAERKNAAVAGQLQAVLDNVSCGITAVIYEDNEAKFLLMNDRYFELLGYTRAQYEKIETYAPIHADDQSQVLDASRQVYLSGTPATIEYRAVKKDGSQIWMRVAMTMTRIEGIDKPVQIAIFNDITVEKLATRELLENLPGGAALYEDDGNVLHTSISEEAISIQKTLPIALRAVMDASSEISFVKDRELRYISLSRKFFQLAGKSDETALLGKTSAAVFPPELAEKYDRNDRSVLESGQSMVDLDILFPTGDGMKHLLFSKYPLLDAEGNVLGLYGTGRDITEAREAKSRLEMLTNSIPGGIAVYEGNPERMHEIRLVYFSDGFSRLFGYTREAYEKLAALNPLGLVASADISHVYEKVQALVKEGVPMNFIYRAIASDGQTKWINVRAVMGEPHGDNLTVNAVFFDVTEQQTALERLRVSEEVNRLAIQQSKNVVCQYDIRAKALSISLNVDPIFGVLPVESDIPDKAVREGKISPSTTEAYLAFYNSILRGDQSGETLFQRSSTRGWRWVEEHFTTIFSESGAPVTAVISFADVTESIEKDSAYKRWQQSMSSRPPESYSLFRCNVSTRTSYDTREGSLLPIRFDPGSFDFDLHTSQYASQYVMPEDRKRFIDFLNADALLSSYYQGNRMCVMVYKEKLAEKGFRWMRLTVELVEPTHSSEVEAYLLFENIDEAKRAELEIVERAERDPLTGVLNRSTFSQKVEQLICQSSPKALHALLMLDIDSFKLVNDVFGHGMGDQVLKDVAQLLSKGSRRGDLVGRLGGDEFVVFLADIPDGEAAAKKARQICELTRKSLSAEVRISGSVGIALYPKDGASFDELYQKADMTLYHVKDTGKNNYAFFREEMAARNADQSPNAEP